MTTMTLKTTAELMAANLEVSRKLDQVEPGSDECRQLLRRRRTVRTELERRQAAESH